MQAAAVEFHIITYASASYADSLRLLVPTWVKNSGAASITVVSGEPIEGLPPSVNMRCFPDIHPTRWVQGCMAKAVAVNRLLPSWPDGAKIVFLDADCAVTGPLAPMFDGTVNLALTRFSYNPSTYRQAHGTCNVGVFAFVVGKAMRRFLRLWLDVQTAYAKHRHGAWGAIACDQYSMTDIARGRALKIHTNCLNYEIWNSNRKAGTTMEDWIKNIERNRPAIIHFKGSKWRDPVLVARCLAAAQDSAGSLPGVQPPAAVSPPAMPEAHTVHDGNPKIHKDRDRRPGGRLKSSAGWENKW